MIEIKNLNKTYDRRRVGENHVLHDVSFTLPDTGFVCILGPSGCGKTSLLNAIGGLDTFDNGTITTGDVSVSRFGTAQFEAERNRSFGYIFQNYYLLQDHSVGYNVYLGLHSLKLSHAEKLRRVKEALAAVEMDRYIRRNVGELSGGQQQRVAIARALARKPRVIFADEPTGNLDETNTINICSLLRRISRQSLVIMVTHEERIAEFFADRIITLDGGRVVHDSDSWQRGSMSAGSTKTIYTGDYPETKVDADQVSLRIFQQEGIEPVQLSVLALEDRIVIKINDKRAVSCGTYEDAPELVEGKRPVVTLQEVDADSESEMLSWESEENIPAKAGSGIRFGDMVREAAHMGKGKLLRSIGTRLFLLVLTLLTALCVSDYITLSSVDPEDFITTHSLALKVDVERGPRAGSSMSVLREKALIFKECLFNTDIDFTYVPSISYDATVSGSPILQLDSVSLMLRDFSYAPAKYLDESTIIMGRMPENSTEMVVDRWVLEKALSEDGVAQNGISDISYFLGKTVSYVRLNGGPTIVGICDSGQCAAYIDDALYVTLGVTGTEVLPLSEFQAMYPGEYDDITLAEDECIVLPNNAGEAYWDHDEDSMFTTSGGIRYKIALVSDISDCYAKIVVADSQIQELMLNMSASTFWIYCEDKAAMTEYMHSVADRMSDSIRITITDSYSDKMIAYTEASQARADARSIVTITVLVLSALMLLLLRRADVHGRIGMLSVYRLLGIPSAKAVQIFVIESLICNLTTSLPAVAGFSTVLAVLRSVGVSDLLFPALAAVLVYLVIMAFHLLVTVIPLRRLLKLPPARLAAKYDF